MILEIEYDLALVVRKLKISSHQNSNSKIPNFANTKGTQKSMSILQRSLHNPEEKICCLTIITKLPRATHNAKLNSVLIPIDVPETIDTDSGAQIVSDIFNEFARQNKTIKTIILLIMDFSSMTSF